MRDTMRVVATTIGLLLLLAASAGAQTMSGNCRQASYLVTPSGVSANVDGVWQLLPSSVIAVPPVEFSGSGVVCTAPYTGIVTYFAAGS